MIGYFIIKVRPLKNNFRLIRIVCSHWDLHVTWMDTVKKTNPTATCLALSELSVKTNPTTKS